MQGYDPNLLSRIIGLSKKNPHQALSILVIPIHENMASGPWTTSSVSAWPPTVSIVHVPLEVLFLQTVTERNDCSGRQLVTISNEEESSFHMQVASLFRRRMAEYGCGEEEVNVSHMHV